MKRKAITASASTTFFKGKRTAARLLGCLSLLLMLTACGEKELQTNPSMQEELENRDPSPPTFFLPEDTGYDCMGEHTTAWKDLGETHLQICQRCGDVLSRPEKHTPSTVLQDGYTVIGEQVYVVTRHLCGCRAVVERVYEPLSEGMGGGGE